jgi:hypothetical protein
MDAMKMKVAQNPLRSSRLEFRLQAGEQLDTAADSLSPPERGEGWGEGI